MGHPKMDLCKNKIMYLQKLNPIIDSAKRTYKMLQKNFDFILRF